MSMFVDIVYADWVDFDDPSNRDFIVKWTWNDPRPAGFGGIANSTTDHFEVMWMYSTLINDPAEVKRTGQREVWHGDETTTKSVTYVPGWEMPDCTFTVPENAVSIQARIQPIPKTQNGSGQSVEPWRGGITWSGAKSVERGLKPEKPDTLKIEQLPDFPNQVVASVNNVKSSGSNKNVNDVEFQLMRFETKPRFELVDDESKLLTPYTVTKTEKSAVSEFDSAGVIWDLEDDFYYAIRCRYITSGGAVSPWSIPTEENTFVSPPYPPTIDYVRKESKTRIAIYYSRSRLSSGETMWQFTPDKENFALFDSWVNEHPEATKEEREQALLANGVTEGMETYNRWVSIDVGELTATVFFRLRTFSPEINGIQYKSAWSDTYTQQFGNMPLAPTVWNTKPYAYLGIDSHIRLYVMHNSMDNTTPKRMIAIGGFSEDLAEDMRLLTPIGGVDTKVGDSNTFYFDVDISQLTEECSLYWRAQTLDGINYTDSEGRDVIKRSQWVKVNIYKKPELSVIITNVVPDSQEDVPIVDSYPIQYETNITMGADHTITAYKVAIATEEAYTTTEIDGTTKYVRPGDTVYEKYMFTPTDLYEQLNANDVILENGITYVLQITATLSTSATAYAEYRFKTKFESINVEILASMVLNKEDMSMSINPVVYEPNGDSWTILKNYVLGVYRINDDGTMVTIGENVPSRDSIYITDPHPNLRDAQYRITATPTSGRSNKVIFYDTAPYPVDCSDIILQWDETYYDTYLIKDVTTLNRDKGVAGSMLRLPFNIDISENTNIETNLVNYVGRKDPVSYFGTHTGYTAQWSAEIPKSDVETIKMLRRLQVYMGNVYVREPSGTGYWAMIKVTFPVNHCALTISVSLDITRVEGGK